MGFWDSVSHPSWGGAAQGAGGGALAGGAVGGPLGAGIGAVAGGLLGAFGSQSNPYQQQMEAFSRMGSPQRGPAAQGQLSGFRQNQSQLVAQLEAQARGEGPSLAAQQLREASDRNSRNQQAMAAGTGGPNAALAQFQAAQMGQMGAAQNAQQAAAARIQEQYNAQSQLGLTLHGARGMDEEMSRYNAGAQNSQASDNLQAKLQNRGMQFGALSTLYGDKAGDPSMGEQILGAGAGLYGFYAGQRGNTPQAAAAPSPGYQWWGSPAGGGMGGGGAPQGGPSPGAGGVPPGVPMDPYGPQPMDPYAGQSPWAPLGYWGAQGGNPHQGR